MCITGRLLAGDRGASRRRATSDEGAEQPGERVLVPDDDVGGLTEVARAFVGYDGDADGELEAVQAAEGVEVGGVVARVQRALQLSLLQQCTDGRALVRLDRRADLQHLAAPARPQPGRDR